ncbi:lipoate--protein ligase family protein [Chlamydia suis]|uniref:lipoate--protein ligase family protein n=1 Tax=Chlamydia suis TaxID=83559 RepID=UPI0009AF8063|nr:lipoate--protein ligase family protein [Chlamydia suis]
MKIRVIDSTKATPEELMEKDRSLLDSLKAGEVILHLYEWEGLFPVTYGYFIKPERFFRADWEALGVRAARRPTGGGVTFHNGDYAFSLLVSSEHPAYQKSVLANYHTVNRFVLRAINRLFRLEGSLSPKESSTERVEASNFCVAKISKYDVLIGDKKIGGASQRSVKQGFLHQGSIFLSGNSPHFYRKILQPDLVDKMSSKMEEQAFFPLGIEAPASVLKEVRGEVKDALMRIFMQEGI